MQLVDLTDETKDTFFCCLNPKPPDDLREADTRRRWFERNLGHGLRAKLLISDDDRIVGMCQYIPIEHSHLVGRDLMASLCMWVHGYDRGVGNQQAKGYGRFMLTSIEEDARASGLKGVAAWGLDWEIWMPVAFFEHMGYERADREDKVIVVWKPFTPKARPPKLKRLTRRPPGAKTKVNVTVAANAWCGCYKIFCARDAIEGIEHMVEYTELDPPDEGSILHLGHAGGIFLDGEVFKPYEVCEADALRAEIIRLYAAKHPT
jgi:N-acetylglutamate synthase-like GNAT family acetyltransferase